MNEAKATPGTLEGRGAVYAPDGTKKFDFVLRGECSVEQAEQTAAAVGVELNEGNANGCNSRDDNSNRDR